MSSKSPPNPIFDKLKMGASAAIVILSAAHSLSKFPLLPARVDTATSSTSTTLTHFLESNTQFLSPALKSLLKQKIESGEDEDALKILNSLISAKPDQTQLKFLRARLLSEMGRNQEALQLFGQICHEKNLLWFEAQFERVLLMEEAVVGGLEKALKNYFEEKKINKEEWIVRLLFVQFEFLRKNVDGALSTYDELAREDPSDCQPYFCKGRIYRLLGRNKEAKEEFGKYRELSRYKFKGEDEALWLELEYRVKQR